MTGRSRIEWTEKVWNPVTGCTKVSAGCAHCYAESNAQRWWGSRPFTEVRTHEDRLDVPLKWRAPSRVFVNSMSDLFHEDVPDEFIADVFAVMLDSPQHTFQVLTKRPERMRALLSDRAFPPRMFAASIARRYDAAVVRAEAKIEVPWPLPNVHLGVSCEDQKWADERIPILLDTPAAVRWVSAEPLIGPIDFSKGNLPGGKWWDYLSGMRYFQPGVAPIENGLDWIVVGGESGHGARPFDVLWGVDIVAQCREAGVPVFMKQLGANPRGLEGKTSDAAGRVMEEWPRSIRVREYPAAALG